MDNNKELLDSLHSQIRQMIKDSAGFEIKEDDLDMMTANVIYYVYAKMNGLNNIIEGIQSYIDTRYADEMVRVFQSQTPQLAEQFKAIGADEFDEWFKKF
jgi:hypothetical protein